MPIITSGGQKYKPDKGTELRWDDFRGGLNSFFRDTEIRQDEMSQAYNLILKGKGIPTKRWGTDTYFNFTSTATGSVRSLIGYYPDGSDPELLAITDQGYLGKRDGASYASINGASWASGYNIEAAQLDEKVYFVSEQNYLKRYNGSALVGFSTIAVPTGLFATQYSGLASGSAKYSYRVTAVSEIGETLACTAYSLPSQPQDPANGLVRVSWTAVSTASGILKGYNIYGRDAGDERFLGSVGGENTVYWDDGSVTPAEFTYTPLLDTTGGFKAKYIIRWEDRLVFAGIEGEPSKVIISGRVPFHERFGLPYGNYVRIEPDAGDDITGLAIFGNRLIVFKERSVWQVTLEEIQIGNYTIYDPVPQLITASHGCVSHRTITPVENDIFFLSSRGVYVLGHEPNIAIDVLRTNEVSVKVRDFFNGLTATERKNTCAGYYDNRYIVAVPGKNQSICFDREKLAWTGPWNKDARIFEVFTDADGNEVLVSGEDDRPVILDWDEDYKTDEGSDIETIFKTKREDFGNWTSFKNVKNVYVNFKNTTGNINVNIYMEDRDGGVTNVKSFTITADPLEGAAGWGADMFGNTQWGDSEATADTPDTDDYVKWARIHEIGRNLQIEVQTVETTGTQNDYELLGIRADVKEIGKGLKGSAWDVD